MAQLAQEMSSVGSPEILVAGELILDEYVWGEVGRISPEAPIPVLRVERCEYRMGGAGRVVDNLIELGAKVRVLSVLGQDAGGERVREMLRLRNVDGAGVLTSPEWPTVSKSRHLAYVQHANRAVQQVLRVDREEPDRVPPEVLSQLEGRVPDAIRGISMALVSDYGKGLLTPEILQRIIRQARSAGVPVYVDPYAYRDYSRYRGATLVSPNRFEAERATGIPCSEPEGYRKAAGRLLEDLDLEAVVVTLDREGIYFQRRGQGGTLFPTRAQSVVEVSGAGDMVLSVLGIAGASGLSFESAVNLANIAAGVEVRKIGAAPVSRREITSEILGRGAQGSDKVVALDALRPIVERMRRLGQRIVFTNGCFDLLHPGHVVLLKEARAFGDALIVGVNTDRSVRENKGPSRPIYNETFRALLLGALECVDYIVFFDDRTPVELLRALKPDVLVKGGDYSLDEVVGREIVESYGGRVVRIPPVEGISTTRILDRILAQHRE